MHHRCPIVAISAIIGALLLAAASCARTAVRTHAAVAAAVVINEVVTHPQTDWSTTGFDGTPGTGAILPGVDEWIELLINVSSLDLTGWHIELLDTSPIAGHIGPEGAFQISRYVGSGTFDHTRAGDRLILGDVVGSHSMNDDIYVVLRDSTGALVDAVEIGDAAQPGDGAPAPGEDGRSTSPADEAIARVPDGIDTGDAAADFTKQVASLGTMNSPPVATLTATGSSSPSPSATATHTMTATAPPTSSPSSTMTATPTHTVTPSPGSTITPTGTATVSMTASPSAPPTSTATATATVTRPLWPTDTATVTPLRTPPAPPGVSGTVIINEIVTDPQHDWNDSEGGDGIAFSRTPGVGGITSTDEWVELLNIGQRNLDLTGWSLVMRDTTPATQILGYGSTVLRFSADGDLTNFQAGERLVIGNPTGVMNNDVELELRDLYGELIDVVRIGDDPDGQLPPGGPGGGQDGNATTTYDEAVSRIPDAWDTGDDVADFDKRPATPGAHNGLYVATHAYLPILHEANAASTCHAMLDIQNVGANFAKALVLTWGSAGHCPPQCNGPSAVACSGLLAPGAAWHVAAPLLQPGHRSAVVLSAFSQPHAAFQRGEEVFADALCESLFDHVINDCGEYSRLIRAVAERAVWDVPRAPAFNFAAFPSQPIAVEVTRYCATSYGVPALSAYAGVTGHLLGRFDPLFGGYAYYVPLLYADWRGWNSILHLQNSGSECTSVEVVFGSEPNCIRHQVCQIPAIAPGDSYPFEVARCVSSGWIGGAWLRSSQPLAIVASTIGADVRTAYVGIPAELNFTLRAGAPFPGQPVDPLFTTGARINYGPLVYREHHGWSTRLQVQNLSGVLPAKVKVWFLDAGGDVVQTLLDWICPGGSRAFEVASISHLPPDWAGHVRVESQPWLTSGGLDVDPPNIASVAQMARWTSPAQTTALEAMAYNLLSEQQVLDWQRAKVGADPLKGAGLVGIPVAAVAKPVARGFTSEIVVQNAVDVPGLTHFAVLAYDQNGLVDLVCETLNARQVEHIQLNRWHYLQPGFRGSAVISAVGWEHPTSTGSVGSEWDNLLGLAAVNVRRVTGLYTSGADLPGDNAAAVVGVPLVGPFELKPAVDIGLGAPCDP